LDVEQQMTYEVFADFFAKECPSTLLRDLEAGEGHSPEVWRKLAAMDGMALTLPETYQGLAGTFTELVLLYEAMGRSLYPSPHLWTVVVAAELILRLGNDKQRTEYLPGIASGAKILTLALAEKGSDDPASVEVMALPDADGFRLNGGKSFVEFAHVADTLLTVTRTEAGVTLFLIPTGRQGITLTRQHEISGGQFYRVRFDDVTINADEVLAPPGEALTTLNDTLDRARLALSARMLGGCQAAFDLTMRYAKEREQFGQRLATFQSIAFRLAEMQTRIDGSRLLLYRTAWQLDQGLPIGSEAALLKALVSDLYQHVTGEAIQIHGGFGFSEEADPQLYYRRAALEAVLLGSAVALRDRGAMSVICF
jgi:alkylation response protein AidB-like acyl-CoA dehydrogenase